MFEWASHSLLSLLQLVQLLLKSQKRLQLEESRLWLCRTMPQRV